MRKIAIALIAFAMIAVSSLLASSVPIAPIAMQVGECAPGSSLNVQTIAPWYCSSINQAVYNDWKEWLPIAMLVIMLSFSIAALVFVMGVAFRNERVRNFAAGEMYEAVATTIIVAIFMVLAAVMFGVLPSLFTGPVDPFDTSLTFIQNTINSVTNLLHSLYSINVRSAAYAAYSLEITQCAGECTSTSIPNVFAPILQLLFIAPADAIARLLVEGLLILNIEAYMIIFALYAAIPVFLLPGVVFRAILPMRSVGGMFMGIAISFYFIMPILFSVAYFFTSGSVLQQLNVASAQINQFGQGVGSQTNAISASSPLVTTLNSLPSAFGSFWISVLFYPSLIMMLVYFCITTLADLLGGIYSTGVGILGRV
ncbi:MAG: hypothetical protein KGH59_04780 [Candidatus Micrarchaeota archaeon]|nr:hypothetical protein [Candidatus Micrarchaeota archaeon]MDE1805065.1 hypothetical protein [Candidatus Micrarchaeota archaeon]MDE1846774.1 hypothetical protein [Candidatus Micrarchaeota archaeon]